MRGTQRTWRWILLVTAGTIGLLGLLTLSTVDRLVLRTPTSGYYRSDGADQVIFQKGVAEDRRSLFNGVLYYQPPKEVDVDDTLEFTVWLTAIRGETPPAWPPGRVVAQRALRVGGVQKAYLFEAGKDVDIEVLGSPIGTIAAPGDEVEWRWYLTPRKPGRYTLKLMVETYRGDSGVLLARSSPPIDIILTARATWGYRITSAQNWLIGLATSLTALTVLATVFRKPLAAILSRFRDHLRRSGRQQP
ncbi:hypothetical protein ACH492_15620 [Streptomyces sp. NPDC019443]|uniref:hypothetical protein n=1 Tax=Streptomyces sp. NPDC019443 TaxID=3365061 RepID=UPI00378D1C15